MKNKKGYTLIEIIIALVLIILIGTISVVTIKKTEPSNDKKRNEYLEKIKLDAAVYYENNKHLEKFEALLKTGDFQIIRIGDLISEGILDENLYNPYRNGNAGDFKDDCVKIILDDDLNIDIQYEELNDEELKCKAPEKKPIYIHINNNNDETNKILLDNSHYIEYGAKLSEKIANGDFIRDKFIDPGAVLRDEYGNEYGTLIGTFTFKDGVATYTYRVNEDYKCSDGTKCYDRIVVKEETRTVTYDDKREPIKIVLNNKEANTVVLDNSYDMYINNGTNLNEKISDGNYIKENFIDSGAVLKDNNGTEYGNLVGKFSFNEKTKEATYTYSIDQTNMYYDIVKQKTVKRVVTYEDNSGPIIIGYSDAYAENSYLYFNFLSYSGYMDFWTMYYNATSNYSIFDNLDGYNSFDLQKYYDYYYLETFDWASNWYMYDQIEISDSSGNKTKYNMKIYQFYNEPPYIWYDENYNDFYDNEIYIYNDEIYPIYNYISVYDIDSSYYSYYYYLYDDYGNYYYTWNTSYLSPGNYTLYINAFDEHNWSSESYNIYINYYPYNDPYYDPPYYDPSYDPSDDYNYCDVACQMYNNSQAWHTASPEEQERLHAENEYLSTLLPEGTYFTDDGYWHNPDGSLLYDPSQ